MYFYLTNKNPSDAFPALPKSGLVAASVTDRDGAEECVLELTKAEDFLTLDSICRVCNTFYKNMTIEGNRLYLNEGSKYEFE